MSFSALPREVIHEILIAAVNVRGIKRASRLRYVSRSWNVAVMEAIFASRILDGEMNMFSYWPRYLAYRTLGRPGRLSRPLRIIRQVAERLVAHRSADGNTCTDDALRDCVFEICDVPHIMMNSSLSNSGDWLRDANWPIGGIDEDDDQFRQALLAAAAWTNEVALIRDLLPNFEDRLYLICQDGGGQRDFELIFGYPLCLAAFRGHNEVVRLFMDAIATGSQENGLLRGTVLEYGAKGNHLSTIELVLEPEYNYWSTPLVSGLKETASLDIFKRLLPLAKDYLQIEFQRKPNHYDEKFLPSQLAAAAGAGNVAMMEHLFELGATIQPRWCRSKNELRNPVLRAAKHGQKNALMCLLNRGFVMNQNSLEAAVRYGNPETVQVVLDNIDQIDSLSQLLSIAIENENEAVVRMLLSFA
ncbi:hypothetical protein F5B20DRAFT_558342 [Whalleya microplaca]|nr:hypothetical protein F5B20DRAFT_558342 [Whalleya microplaca]